MAKKDNLTKTVKELDQMTKDMGIETTNIHATKITIETAEGKTIVLDPMKCTASVMKGYEEYGINFQIQATIKEGSLK